MLVETWVAVLIALFLFVTNSILAVSGMKNDDRLEEERAKNEALMKENEELKRYIAVQKTKAIIGVATDYYNEGDKK